MRLFLPLATLFASLALSGCVTMTNPVPTGPDTWMIGMGARGGFSSDAELLSQTIGKAGEFCKGMGRRMEVQGSSYSGTQGWTPQSNTVNFRCLGKSSNAG